MTSVESKRVSQALKALSANVKKTLHWGPKGVFNYLKSRPGQLRIRRMLLRGMNDMSVVPVRGISVIGELTRFGSGSKTLRDFAYALREAGVPMQTFNTDLHPQTPATDTEGILTPPGEFHIRKYDHIVEILPSVVPLIAGVSKSRIAFWEFESGFEYAYPDMRNEEQVIAMSDFNAEYFRRILPKEVKVVKIPYPFRFEAENLPSRDDVRRTYGIGSDDFMVFFNFDYGSGFNRKNPDGAMRAFARAFRSVSKAKLVFKTKGATTHPDRVKLLRDMANELGIAERYISIDQYVPQKELFGLTNACDVYLSLHRGEGFGITLAEAMSMGRPVVCTDYSSTTEFCRPGCTMPVPCCMVNVRPDQVDHPYYRKVEKWAEADVDDAAAKLRGLYFDSALRSHVGAMAREAVERLFSVSAFRDSINNFMDQPV